MKTAIQIVQDTLTYSEYVHLEKACAEVALSISDVCDDLTIQSHSTGDTKKTFVYSGIDLMTLGTDGVYIDAKGNTITMD